MKIMLTFKNAWQRKQNIGDMMNSEVQSANDGRPELKRVLSLLDLIGYGIHIIDNTSAHRM
jgi:hypothetical protein